MTWAVKSTGACLDDRTRSEKATPLFRERRHPLPHAVQFLRHSLHQNQRDRLPHTGSADCLVTVGENQVYACGGDPWTAWCRNGSGRELQVRVAGSLSDPQIGRPVTCLNGGPHSPRYRIEC